MFRNIRLLFIMAFVLLGTFAFAEETTTSAVTVSSNDETAVEVETEDGVEESKTTDTASVKEPKTTKETKTKKEDDAAASEKEQKKQEKIDRYQARIMKHIAKTVDGYDPAAFIPVLDMYHDRMMGSGTACVVTGSIMFTLAPVMIIAGGIFGFSKSYGGSVIEFADNSITFYDANKDMLPYFISGTVVFSMGMAFELISLIITPMCAIYFSQAHKSTLVIRRLKGLAMLKGIGINYINDGDHDKLGLSYGIRI